MIQISEGEARGELWRNIVVTGEGSVMQNVRFKLEEEARTYIASLHDLDSSPQGTPDCIGLLSCALTG